MQLLFKITLLFSIYNIGFSQKSDYSTLKIADSLKQNANSVVRLHQIDINISNQRSMKINIKRIITIFNENGMSSIDAIEHYDKKTTVNDIQATIYNSLGTEIKKIKRKDFRDQCVIDGFSIFSDSRLIYLNYTPTNYPFTIVYESEVETSNTAFIRPFVSINDYYSSIENSVYNITYPEKLGLKFKENNFSKGYEIKKVMQTPTQVSFEAKNIVAQKPEEMGLNFVDFMPIVYFGLENFNLEGVDGTATTWAEFGQWYSEKILKGTTVLPEETKLKIQKLIGNETNLVKKAKIIYKFVQEKSRYVSIQVGIGGFKPMFANDVDRLGYGDCKALSNYTKALLEVVNVPSYNTILYGGSNKQSIKQDMVSIQGNHMMLCLPNGDKNIFLECTSQDNPFGYQGIFTDDRDVLIIKPEGGEIVRTAIYENEDNSQLSQGKYNISETGAIFGTISIKSTGTQFAKKYDLSNKPPEQVEKHYKQYWSNINNLTINKTGFENDNENIVFSENVIIEAENYGKIINNNLIFPVNVFNIYNNNLKKNRNRKTAFEVTRGFFDQDEIEVDLPLGFVIESLPNNYELHSKFGEYKTEIIKKTDSKLIFKRSFLLKKAIYKNTEFEEYRLFLDQISRNDNAKLVLLKQN